MSVELRDKHIMRLWSLALAGGGDWNKNLSPKLDPKDRVLLKSAGLIDAENRRPEGSGRAVMHLELTDRGWSTLSDRMGDPIDKKVSAAAAFGKLLGCVRSFLDREQMSLAEFIRPSEVNPPAPGQGRKIDLKIDDLEPDTTSPRPVELPEPDVGWPQIDLPGRIESAYLRLSGNEAHVRVRLADLRDELADVDRTDLDAALLELAESKKFVLYNLDDPFEITARDREAAFETPFGETRHILYLREAGR